MKPAHARAGVTVTLTGDPRAHSARSPASRSAGADSARPVLSDPGASLEYMFDTDRPGPVFAPVSLTAGAAASPDEPPAVPLERLEAQLCELAGHLAAATCRFLVLLADFDARRGWASWEMNSCAQWLSWKCQLSSGTAREHVRVARALRDLPVIRARFAAAALSYAKVRALTRIEIGRAHV